MIKQYLSIAHMTWRGKTNEGLLVLLPDVLWKILYLIPLIFLWRVVFAHNPDVNMTLAQMLAYTYASTLLGEMLNVRTVMSGWLYEGQMLSIYGRPAPVFGQLIAQTAGGWVPMLLAFSSPMVLLAPLFGIDLLPASLWFFPSLLLCISLGFALDFLFACLTIRLAGMSWLVYSIRMAVVSLFAGAVIPFRLLPFGWGEVLAYQPFASLGGAPLSLLVGIGDPMQVIGMQLLWNLIFWPAAGYFFRKSQERMMSYGG